MQCFAQNAAQLKCHRSAIIVAALLACLSTSQLLVSQLRGGGGGGGVEEGGPFFSRLLWEKNHNYFILHLFFNVYMSKGRQFKGLSTGMFILTIPNHTFKLQLDIARHLIFLKKVHPSLKALCHYLAS